MTVGELIELLSEYDEDAPVRLMTQPSYPLQYGVAGVVDAGSLNDPADFDGPVAPETVYILEGSQLGYGSRDAWNGGY